MTIDFTKIERYDEECRGYGGYSLENNATGRWVDFDEMVAILAAHGIECRTAESVANEKFEAEMIAKHGEKWRG